jgi:hypothetical protein
VCPCAVMCTCSQKSWRYPRKKRALRPLRVVLQASRSRFRPNQLEGLLLRGFFYGFFPFSLKWPALATTGRRRRQACQPGSGSLRRGRRFLSRRFRRASRFPRQTVPPLLVGLWLRLPGQLAYTRPARRCLPTASADGLGALPAPGTTVQRGLNQYQAKLH